MAHEAIDVLIGPEDGTLIECVEVPPIQWSRSGIDTRYVTTRTYIEMEGELEELIITGSCPRKSCEFQSRSHLSLWLQGHHCKTWEDSSCWREGLSDSGRYGQWKSGAETNRGTPCGSFGIASQSEGVI